MNQSLFHNANNVFTFFLNLWKRRTWFIVTMYFKEKSPKPFTKCEHGYKNRFTREWKEHLLCNSSRSVIKYDGPRACMKKHCCAKKTKLSRNFRQFVAFNRKMFESMRTDEKQKKTWILDVAHISSAVDMRPFDKNTFSSI